MENLIELFFRVPNKVQYKNWKGEIAERTIMPYHVFFGATEYHEEEQWLLEAHCLDKEELRTFALKDMVPITPNYKVVK